MELARFALISGVRFSSVPRELMSAAAGCVGVAGAACSEILASGISASGVPASGVLASGVLASAVLASAVLASGVSISEVRSSASGASATAGAGEFVDQISRADSNALAPIQVEAALYGTEIFPVQPDLPSSAVTRRGPTVALISRYRCYD